MPKRKIETHDDLMKEIRNQSDIMAKAEGKLSGYLELLCFVEKELELGITSIRVTMQLAKKLEALESVESPLNRQLEAASTCTEVEP